MENVPPVPPPPKVEIPNYTNYQPDQEMFRLRKRLGDLMRLGAGTPATFQQAILQIWQEAERQRQSCMTAAENHLRQYHQYTAQASAFAMYSSIAYSVINGYVTIEERRFQELQERAEQDARARAETEAEAKKASEVPAQTVAPAPTVTAPAQEGAAPAVEAPKSPGVKRKKR